MYLFVSFTENEQGCGISRIHFSRAPKQRATDPLASSGFTMKAISSFDYLGTSWRWEVFNYILHLYT